MKTLKTIWLSISLLILFTQSKAQNAVASVNNVLNAYFDVKNALVSANVATAKAKARELLSAVNNVKTDQLNAGQKALWTTHADKLEYDARHISESSEIDHQREHFTNLSKNMFEVIKGFKLNTVTVYHQYCPMKKATWLSETAAIKNPYFGNKMLTCGKTTDTLAPAGK